MRSRTAHRHACLLPGFIFLFERMRVAAQWIVELLPLVQFMRHV